MIEFVEFSEQTMARSETERAYQSMINSIKLP